MQFRAEESRRNERQRSATSLLSASSLPSRLALRIYRMQLLQIAARFKWCEGRRAILARIEDASQKCHSLRHN